MQLTGEQVLALRLRSLLLTPQSPGFASVGEVVNWFGAMQAQDLASGMWSLGARLPGSTVATIHHALEAKQALRTWPMRGTVHFVPPADARWMLQLTGVKALAGAARRREHLGLDSTTTDRAVEVLGTTLAEHGRLTRAQCLQALIDDGLPVTGQLGYHLLWYTSQRGVTCIGPNIGNEQTIVLLDDWVGKHNEPSEDEALAILATRYFRSHGPTTRQDFAGWTGLTAAQCKAAIAHAADSLTQVVCTDGSVEMYCSPKVLDATPIPDRPATGIDVLPGFDEYLLGFKDRTLMLDPAFKQAIIPGGNGIFRSTIVRDGRVIGTWMRKSAAKSKLTLTVKPLVKLSATARREIESSFDRYGDYLGQNLAFFWTE